MSVATKGARHALVVVGAALAAASPVAAEPAAAPVPSVRSVVTRALMRELAHSDADLGAIVDRDAGVVYIDHFAGAAGEPARPVERRLCGRALDRKLRVMRGWLYAALHGDPDEGEQLACSNRPGPPTCSFGGSMEYDPVVRFRFRVDPVRGVVLHAITITDEVLVSAADIAREHRTLDRVITRLGATSCPTP